MSNEERYAEYLEDVEEGDPGSLDPSARAELDDLRGTLGSNAVWAEPPPGLSDDIVAAIRHAASEAPPSTSQAPERTPSRPHRLRWTLAAAAAAVVLVGVAAVAVLTARDDGPGQRVQLSATALAPDASAEATVAEEGSGLSISLSIADLPPAPAGTFYQAWMKGPDGSVPIGTFHAREGDGPIELWSGVDTSDYPTMTVTIQQEGAGPESSGKVVLSGKLPTLS